MIVILKHGVTEDKRDQLIRWFNSQGLGVDVSVGEFQTILGLIGDVLSLDTDMIESLDIVQATRRVTEPFKRCNRKFQPDDTVVNAGGAVIGGGHFGLMAGLPALANEEQMISAASEARAAGADIILGCPINTRVTSYTIQEGIHRDIELLKAAKAELGIPTAKEILSVEDVPKYEDIDIIVVEERNMANYPLLAELGAMDKPVVLKRSISATLEEMLITADYIMAGGNKNVILCERGIRTFSDYTKLTLDISAVPMLKELSHLPVIVDASRSTGLGRLTRSMSRAASAAGADGLMIDIQNGPAGKGSLAVSADEFAAIARDIQEIRKVIG